MQRSKLPSGEIEDRLEYYATQTNWTAKQIHKQITEDFPNRGMDIPALRTVQERVKRLRVRDTSGRWVFAEADPGEAGPVLESIAAVIEQTDGRIRQVTRAEAAWITRLANARPTLPAYERWFLARFYLTRTANNDPVGDLDSYLAFAPWESPEARERYVTAIEEGWIQSGPAALHTALSHPGATWRTEDGKSYPATIGAQWLAEGSDTLRRRRKEQGNGE